MKICDFLKISDFPPVVSPIRVRLKMFRLRLVKSVLPLLQQGQAWTANCSKMFWRWLKTQALRTTRNFNNQGWFTILVALTSPPPSSSILLKFHDISYDSRSTPGEGSSSSTPSGSGQTASSQPADSQQQPPPTQPKKGLLRLKSFAVDPVSKVGWKYV